jgi:hypothetical protein
MIHVEQHTIKTPDTPNMNTRRAQEAPHTEYQDIRCPQGPKKLLAKLSKPSEEELQDYRESKRIVSNLLELSCRDCTKETRREAVERGQEPPLRVLHRYNLVGELVETVVEYP